MPLYPSVEDFEVDKMAHVQRAVETRIVATAAAITSGAGAGGLYDWQSLGSLQELMYGSTDISASALEKELGSEIAILYSGGARPKDAESRTLAMVTAPDNLGLARAEIKQGLSPMLIAKDAKGMLGIAPVAWDSGVFVGFVWSGSNAAMAGIRFGDQILRINGKDCTAMTQSVVLKLIREADPAGIELIVRDRPYARTLTFQKDAKNICGFGIKYGEITSLVKDTSAVRNGLLTRHHLLEVNGQNVVGMPDKEIIQIIQESPPSVTVTIAPSFIYKKMINGIGFSRIKKYMDHSVPEA